MTPLRCALAVPPLLLLALACAAPAVAPPTPSSAGQPTAESDGLPTIEAFAVGLERHEGFLPVLWSAERGRVWLEVPPEDVDVLHYVSLSTGLGSNDVGLDRGQISRRALVRFRRVGPKVLLVAPNLAWRSSSEEPEVRRGVEESFAPAVLFGFEPVARQGERILVDATDLFLSDAHGIAAAIERAREGSFELDPSRSALDGTRLATFPENTEVEALLTFTSDEPGREVASAAADGGAPSFRVRHSFVRLPDLADHPYRPRAFDPRSGFFPTEWTDVSAPIDAPASVRVVTRHHLTADDPIVYFVDRAAPEPVRTALLEGARAWEPVFAAAGHPGGFRVELLPEGADPLDVRRNVITWVNRTTRGWSYGDVVTDPRTGEILKGHVSLGALRVRQDVLLFEGLLAPYGDDRRTDERVREAALARLRQLAAHEVGHTLGLAHNFAASADGRASVMDYPAPLVGLLPPARRGDGLQRLDLSEAYAPGCGAWDELAIRYGYADFGEDEAGGLARVLAEMRARGLDYLSDADARGPGMAHPLASLWDNGDDAVEALRTTYDVRRIALARLSERALVPGRALAELERVVVPLHLAHRYQLEAVVRLVGGVAYDYSMVGEDGIEGTGRLVPVPAAAQRTALDAALASLDPENLALPPALLERLLPPPPGLARDRESFEPGTTLLDPMAPVRAAAELALGLLLDPERAARLADQARDPALPTLDEVLGRLSSHVLGVLARDRGVGFELQTLLVDRLMRLAAPGGRTDARVQRAAWEHLAVLETRLGDGWQAARVRRFLADPRAEAPLPEAPRVPPGSPIGADACSFLPRR